MGLEFSSLLTTSHGLLDTVAGSIFGSSVTLTPLVASLVASLNTASASLALLGAVDPTTGGSPATIAAATAPIVSVSPWSLTVRKFYVKYLVHTEYR